MTQFIGCDAHKKYSVFVAVQESGQAGPPVRVAHEGEAFLTFLRTLPVGSPIAVETTGHWYWMVEEMERAGHVPLLTHAGKAKLMMGQVNKTDKLDARGLALLLRNGTLPTVWIPPGELRDQRELVRHRMLLVALRTRLKNRLQATLAKYGQQVEGVSDAFGRKGRRMLGACLARLPRETQRSAEEELRLLDQLAQHLQATEQRMRQLLARTPEVLLLMSLPGVGLILAQVMAFEIGSVERFADAEHLASYAGTVPRVHSSGGKTYWGPVRKDVNRYLKWAFVEAANCVARNSQRWAHRHVGRLYQRLRERKGHGKAAVAVARHLAEASFWMLHKGETYREPRPISSTPR